MKKCECKHKIELDGNADELIMINGYWNYLTDFFNNKKNEFICPNCTLIIKI